MTASIRTRPPSASSWRTPLRSGDVPPPAFDVPRPADLGRPAWSRDRTDDGPAVDRREDVQHERRDRIGRVVGRRAGSGPRSCKLRMRWPPCISMARSPTWARAHRTSLPPARGPSPGTMTRALTWTRPASVAARIDSARPGRRPRPPSTSGSGSQPSIASIGSTTARTFGVTASGRGAISTHPLRRIDALPRLPGTGVARLAHAPCAARYRGGMHVRRGALGWGVFLILAGSIPLLVRAGVLSDDAGPRAVDAVADDPHRARGRAPAGADALRVRRRAHRRRDVRPHRRRPAEQRLQRGDRRACGSSQGATRSRRRSAPSTPARRPSSLARLRRLSPSARRRRAWHVMGQARDGAGRRSKPTPTGSRRTVDGGGLFGDLCRPDRAGRSRSRRTRTSTSTGCERRDGEARPRRSAARASSMSV